MKPKRLIPAIAIYSLLVAGLVVICLTSLAFSQATEPDDATCLGCHDGVDLTLRPTIHRLSSEVKTSKSSVACVSCHTGGSTHIEDPNKENIGNPARMTGPDALSLCSSCHVPHPEMSSFGANGHNLQQMNCASCHTVHSGKNSLLRDDQARFCLDCHPAVVNQFARRSAHPVRQQDVTCLSCHSMVQSADMEMGYSLNKVCEDCHADVAGPYLYDHEAVHGWSAEGSGCSDCHNPHGSENDKLLRQPTNQMCKQCHTVPGHAVAPTTVAQHRAVAADGDFSRMACIDCHTDVHGSNNNNRLLDPDLPARSGTSCWCHGLR
jgi:DmsE family decaheme c-type cytochrome